jgi:hypothetical protein
MLSQRFSLSQASAAITFLAADTLRALVGWNNKKCGGCL